MSLNGLSIITGAFVLALWALPSEALAEADCATWNTVEFFEVATPADVSRCLVAGADLEARTEWGSTPLHFAAGSGPPETVEALVEAGADLEARDEWGNTPLHLAAMSGPLETVQVLLDAGADPGAQDKNGKFPFDLIREDSPLIGTGAYWRLNDARWK